MSMWMSKNLDFYADFISGRKFLKSVPEKIDTYKTVFSEDIRFFRKIVFRDYFPVNFLKYLSNLKSAQNCQYCDTHVDLVQAIKIYF
jgi:hypothetical protein